MIPRELRPNIYSVGAVDWDRRLFDELIPLPNGTSYNAYLIIGDEETALIDTVDPKMTETLIQNLKRLNVESINYVIANHAEQDHSGAIPQILKLNRDAKVISTPRCKALLIDLLHIPEDRFITVNDGETISLGNKTLKFIHFPWVHWPETMLTYLEEDKILFTCDLFGSHLATSSLYIKDESIINNAAKRYYAEIMMPFRTIINRNMKKIMSLEIELIAPSHGPIYDKPKLIIEAYMEWISAPPKNLVLLPYISMHESTRSMVKYLIDALIERGISVKQFNLSRTDLGELAISLVDLSLIHI